MRGVYVISYPKNNNGKFSKTSIGFKNKGIRFYLYVALLKIKGEIVEVVEC